jgi:NAD(P)-dependent dehydrogenase (short-subunit alcohol dehydrogenase family)
MVSTPGGLLAGRVVAIAGVGAGLGRAIAVGAARHGADVLLVARRQESLDAIAGELAELDARAATAALDLTAEDGPDRLAGAARERFGGLDALVYNAFSTGPMVPAEQTVAADWREAYEINVLAAVRTTLASAELLAAKGEGAVVMVNSQAARRSQPRRGPYAASKAALLSAARTLAGELGPRGIRVNSVVPGHIWGDALAGFFAQTAERRRSTAEEVYASVARETALRRIPTAEEVANAIVFLASPLASGITGPSLDVNAGNWYE